MVKDYESSRESYSHFTKRCLCWGIWINLGLIQDRTTSIQMVWINPNLLGSIQQLSG